MNSESPNARSARHSAGLQNLFKLLLGAIIFILVNWLGFKHYNHTDLSSAQYYTLSQKTKDELKKLDAPLHIYTLLNPHSGNQEQEIQNLIKEYVNAQPKYVSFEKIDPDLDQKRALDLQKELHFSGTDYVVVLEYDKKSPRYVKQQDFYDMNPMSGQVMGFKGEQSLTGAIVALIEGKPSKVYFTEGHGEHSINDSNPGSTGYGQIASILKDDNVEASTINLAEKGEVPPDAEAIVIAGPTIPLAPVEVSAIDKYLQENGKLMILLDPRYTSGLEAVLQKYGLKYEDDVILHQVGNGTPGSSTTEPIVGIYQGGFSMQPITQKLAEANVQLIIQYMGTRSITIPNVPGPGPSKTQFLLQTDPDAWGYIGNPSGPPPDLRTLAFNKVTDIAGPLNIAAQYDGGTTTDPKTKATMNATRIVAIGCSKFVSNNAIEDVGATVVTNSVSWLVKKDAVLDIEPRKPTDYGVALSPLSFRTLAWTSAGFIPGVALLFGILVWFSRRK